MTGQPLTPSQAQRLGARAIGKVYSDGRRIFTETPFRFKDTVKKIPGSHWEGGPVWSFPFTAAAARNLHDVLGKFDIDFDPSIWELLENHDKAAAKKESSDLPDVPRSNHSAWNHQRQAFWFAKDKQAVMIAMDMGTGKSKVAIDLIVNNDCKTTLIVCPRNVVGVWPSEFMIHSANQDMLILPLNRGSVERKTKAAEDAWKEAKRLKKPLVVIINYESAFRDPFGPSYDTKNSRYREDGFAVTHEWDCIILDESQKIKAHNGRASQFCARLRNHATRRYCLTGTPMPHSPLDVFAQYRFLDPSIFGGSFTAFRNKYAKMGGYLNKQVIGYEDLEGLNEKFFSIGFRVGKEVLGLLEPVHVPKVFDLSSKAQKIYDAMETEYVALVDSGELVADNALVKLLRLQQITSGHVKDDDEVEHEIDTGKRDVLYEVVEDMRQFDPESGEVKYDPVVVFCRFTPDLENVKWVAEKLGLRYGELSGRRRDAIDERSKLAPDIDIAGVQIQSGGVGIDFTRARFGIYYSVGYSLGDYDQSLSRIHRPGQDNVVTYVHIMSSGTVDEDVYDALAQRKDVVDYVLIKLSQKAKHKEAQTAGSAV